MCTFVFLLGVACITCCYFKTHSSLPNAFVTNKPQNSVLLLLQSFQSTLNHSGSLFNPSSHLQGNNTERIKSHFQLCAALLRLSMLIVLPLGRKKKGVPAINSARNGHKMDPMRRGRREKVFPEIRGAVLRAQTTQSRENFFSQKGRTYWFRNDASSEEPRVQLSGGGAAPSSSRSPLHVLHWTTCLPLFTTRRERVQGGAWLRIDDVWGSGSAAAGWLAGCLLSQEERTGTSGVAVTCVWVPKSGASTLFFLTATLWQRLEKHNKKRVQYHLGKKNSLELWWSQAGSLHLTNPRHVSYFLSLALSPHRTHIPASPPSLFPPVCPVTPPAGGLTHATTPHHSEFSHKPQRHVVPPWPHAAHRHMMTMSDDVTAKEEEKKRLRTSRHVLPRSSAPQTKE